MLINARPLRDDQGEVQGGLVVFHDLTRRKNNERRQAAQYATTRVLAEVDSLNEANPRSSRSSAGTSIGTSARSGESTRETASSGA